MKFFSSYITGEMSTDPILNERFNWSNFTTITWNVFG